MLSLKKNLPQQLKTNEILSHSLVNQGVFLYLKNKYYKIDLYSIITFIVLISLPQFTFYQFIPIYPLNKERLFRLSYLIESESSEMLYVLLHPVEFFYVQVILLDKLNA